jgi:hypothetical protein
MMVMVPGSVEDERRFSVLVRPKTKKTLVARRALGRARAEQGHEGPRAIHAGAAGRDERKKDLRPSPGVR